MLLGARGRGQKKPRSLQGGSNTTHTSLRRTEQVGAEAGVLDRALGMESGALGSGRSSGRDNCMIQENHLCGFAPGLSFSIWKMEL